MIQEATSFASVFVPVAGQVGKVGKLAVRFLAMTLEPLHVVLLVVLLLIFLEKIPQLKMV